LTLSYGDAEIEFSKPENNRNFTLIQGAGGSGKTNFLRAITWCFYGNEIRVGNRYAGLPIVNNKTWDKLSPNDVCEVKVEIQIKDDEDKLVLIQRSAEFLKLGNSLPKQVFENTQNLSSNLMAFTQIGKDMVSISEPALIVNRMIPQNIAEFSFFDGERLDHYFKENSGQVIENTIHKIIQLDLFDNIIKDLNRDKRDFIRKIGKLKNIKNDILNKQIVFCDKCLEEAEQIKNEIQNVLQRKIEAEAREHFFNLTWKKDCFKDLKIGNNYSISLLDQSGMDIIGTLAAGDWYILALSLLIALHKVLEINVPIIIDSFFGRLSFYTEKIIADYLPKLFDGKQIILLVNKDSFSPEIREKLSNYIGKEYEIVSNETTYFKEKI
jgi:DNA repair exonuclease SbcCD ATPase subunit